MSIVVFLVFLPKCLAATDMNNTSLANHMDVVALEIDEEPADKDMPIASDDDDDVDSSIESSQDKLNAIPSPLSPPSKKRGSKKGVWLSAEEWNEVLKHLPQSPYEKKDITLMDTSKYIIRGLIVGYCILWIYTKLFRGAQTVTNFVVPDQNIQVNDLREEHQLLVKLAVNKLLNRLFAAVCTVIIANFIMNISQ